jgi:hypothetical protein
LGGDKKYASPFQYKTFLLHSKQNPSEYKQCIKTKKITFFYDNLEYYAKELCSDTLLSTWVYNPILQAYSLNRFESKKGLIDKDFFVQNIMNKPPCLGIFYHELSANYPQLAQKIYTEASPLVKVFLESSLDVPKEGFNIQNNHQLIQKKSGLF